MSEALERLKDIGAQKIYEDTHIPVEHVQAILYESFDGLNKVQFIGFVSILEREYGEDLSAVRARGVGYFDEKNSPDEAITDEAIFKSSSKKKNLTLIYIIFAIILLVVAIFYTMQSADKTLQSATKENKIIQDVQKNIAVDINKSENNSSDVNESTVVVVDNNASEPQKIKEPKAVVHTLQIIARTKVWLGYVDVATDQKYQKTFEGAFDLDPSKEWLLYFGHGYIDVVIDGKKEVFNSKDTLRLHYQNGKLTKISLNDFKKLNRGNTW
jgi:preprotein translocase subunit SecG